MIIPRGHFQDGKLAERGPVMWKTTPSKKGNRSMGKNETLNGELTLKEEEGVSRPLQGRKTLGNLCHVSKSAREGGRKKKGEAI